MHVFTYNDNIQDNYGCQTRGSMRVGRSYGREKVKNDKRQNYNRSIHNHNLKPAQKAGRGKDIQNGIQQWMNRSKKSLGRSKKRSLTREARRDDCTARQWNQCTRIILKVFRPPHNSESNWFFNKLLFFTFNTRIFPQLVHGGLPTM